MKKTMTLLLVLMLSGCCTCREQYEPALSQWQENLEALRPTMQNGANLLPEQELTDSKMANYDRTIQGIKRVRGEGPEVWTTPAGGGQ